MPAQEENPADQQNQFETMQREIDRLEQELSIQRQIAYAAGIFQQDVTARTLLESIAEGVIVCDQRGYIVAMNNRIEALFGYTVSDLVGRNLHILLPDRFVEGHAAHMRHFFERPHIRPMGLGLDLAGKRRDGTEFPIEVSLSYLRTEHENFGFAFVTDISQRKEAEEALKLRNEELDAFAHTVAHDLKASIATVIGLSAALVETHRELPPQELDDYLLGLARSGRRMNNIISELLVFASVRKEGVVSRLTEMKPIVDDVFTRLQYAVREFKAEVSVADPLHSALGYAPWIEEVWYNYISNALKYGGEPPLVDIGSTLHEQFVEYWVRDNGPGISAEKQQAIFAPYGEGDMPRIQGHGLGLSIVKRIVEKLDGYVAYRTDAETGGACFSFFLRRNLTNELDPGEN